MIGIVLAAGASRRLYPLTDRIPKTLLTIRDDRTILDFTLANFREVGINRVAIVVGYRHEAIESQVRRLSHMSELEIRLVFNDRAESWNNAYSLWCARDYLVQGAIIANGDTLHSPEVEQRLLASGTPGLTIAIDDRKQLGHEEMKVQLDASRDIRRISKLLDPFESDGEFIGISRVDAAAAPALIEALASTWRGDPSEFYEAGYQLLTNEGCAVHTLPIGASDWVEVDTVADLSRAREIGCRL